MRSAPAPAAEAGYQLTRLANGVRIASIEMPHMKSVSVGFWAAIGGRHERPEQGGLAHFLEHLLFKGTERRSSKQITESVEGLGGYINAFTTEDHTCYYAKAGAQHFSKICDVLADMYQHSQLAPVEIERERDVIREEILMYRDNPGQHSQELLSEAMWPRHALGRPLTGTLETIARFQRPQIQEFHSQHYNGRTTIVTVAGPIPHAQAVAELTPLLEEIKPGRVPRFTRAGMADNDSGVRLFAQDTSKLTSPWAFTLLAGSTSAASR
jgi:predicted Zn-dependent peptidase